MATKPSIVLGPLLGVESNIMYTVCALMHFEGDLNPSQIKLTLDGRSYDATYTQTIASYYFLRFEVNIPPDPEESRPHTYQITSPDTIVMSTFGEDTFTFWVPSIKKVPKIAFASCCGFHSKAIDHNDKTAYAGWDKMLESKIDLLVLSGDQVYADRMWEMIPEAKESLKSGLNTSDHIKAKLDDFYLNLYIKSWGQPSMAKALATIPNVMTWDDHDIIDGYGSHSKGIQNSPLFKDIYTYASKYYEYFQLRSVANTSLRNSNDDYSAFFTFRNFSFILPDTRRNRSRKFILGQNGFKILRDINANLKPSTYRYYDDHKNMNTLCFVLPVPIAHRNFNSLFEKCLSLGTGIFQKFWPGSIRISIDDDLVDHWDHPLHVKEQQKLVETIIDFGTKHEPYSIIIASGDVHSAGAASIKYGPMALCQIISSPIVNNPVHEAYKWLSRLIAKDKNIVGGSVVMDLKEFGDSPEIIFNQRNFMTVKDNYDQDDEQDAIPMETLKAVVNTEVPTVSKKNRSGNLIALLYMAPWDQNPLPRTINKFIK